MVQLLAITDYIDSLAEAETRLGLSRNDDPSFFTEWSIDLAELTPIEQQRLDLIKQRYLYHRVCQVGSIAIQFLRRFFVESPTE